MFVSTSNYHKITEYKAFGIDARLGPDIKEVLGTVDEVIIYKILSSPVDTLVEDTVLEIEGKQIVDIKFKLKNIIEDNEASWITSLGYHDGSMLYVYRGIVKGKMIIPRIELERSFEPCFVPIGSDKTLYELKLKGQKHKYSARLIAVKAFKDNNPIFSRKISDIPAWGGEYQDGGDF
ncbi:non-canonical purine NTP pyrophosphatase [Mucilaginibacter sp. AW1-3]